MKRKNCVVGTKVVVKDYKGVPFIQGWQAQNYIGKELTIYHDDKSSLAPLILMNESGNHIGYAYPQWLKLADKKQGVVK